jgi:hypothetical protein
VDCHGGNGRSCPAVDDLAEIGQPPLGRIRELLGKIGVLLGVPAEQLVPLVLRLGPARQCLTHVVEDFLRDVEMLIRVPAQLLLRQPNLLLAQRRAMGLGRVVHIRTAIGDVRAKLNDRGPPDLALGLDQGPLEALHIVAVAVDLLDVPSVRLEAFGPVFGEGQLRRPIDADMVVIVQVNQLAQFQVPGERTGFRGNPLHQVAIAH